MTIPLRPILALFTRSLAIALCILSSIHAQAQLSATLRADSNHIEIGDHLALKLVVNANPGAKIAFPRFDGDTLGRMTVVSRDKIDTAALGNKIIYSQTITVSAYDSGFYLIPPVAIPFSEKGSEVIDTARTNNFILNVTTLPVDTSKPIRPIKAPLKVDYTFSEFKWWIIGAILMIIALIAAYILYRRYNKKPEAAPVRPRPKVPAHIWAMQELGKLEEEKLWQNDKSREYYSRLTEILRSYLEYRFDYYALESTTEEIRTDIENLGLNLDASGRLMDILQLADFVKFAKMNPAPDQNSKSMNDAITFVDITKPKPEEVKTPQQDAPRNKRSGVKYNKIKKNS